MAILSGWWNGAAYVVVSKRKFTYVNGKKHRSVELKLLHDPTNTSEYEWVVGEVESISKPGHLWIPISQFNKHFKIDNNLYLIYGKEI